MESSGKISFQNSSPQKKADILSKKPKHTSTTQPNNQKQNSDEQRLTDLTDISEKILFKFKSGHPLDLIPDQVTIDPTKIGIISNTIFGPTEYHSIPISIITDITLDTGALFSTLKIYQREFKDSPNIISYIEKKDALYASRLLEGLVLAQTKNIDFSGLPTEEIRKEVEKLGEIH